MNVTQRRRAGPRVVRQAADRSATSPRAASRPTSSSPGTSGSARGCRRSASAFGEGLARRLPRHARPGASCSSPGALRGLRPRELAFAGVLVPSVDRVGRYFPLTLVASLPRVPELAARASTPCSPGCIASRTRRSTRCRATGRSTSSKDALADLGPPGGDGGGAGRGSRDDRSGARSPTRWRAAAASSTSPASPAAPTWRRSSPAPPGPPIRRGRRCAAWRSGSPTRRAGRSCW